MPRLGKEERQNLPISRRINWKQAKQEFGVRLYEPPLSVDMMRVSLDKEGNSIQGKITETIVGSKEDPEKIEIIWDREYVLDLLSSQLMAIGVIRSGVPNETMCNMLFRWDDPEELGQVFQYAATEGIRRLEDEDRAKAIKAAADFPQGTPPGDPEYWMAIYREARRKASGDEDQPDAKTQNGKPAKATAKAGSK